MSSLRYSLLSDDRRPGELGRGLGVIILCLMISVWIHLVGFIIWQSLDKGAADSFYFELADQSPVMELNLIMNNPPPVEMSAEALIPENPGENTIPAEAPADPPPPDEAGAELTAEAAEPPDFDEAIDENVLNAALAAALNAPPLEVDDALARSELLPAPESQESSPGTPDPPISLEGEAPEHKSYYTAIRRAVNNRWLIPPEAKNRFRPGRLTVDFIILPDGSLSAFVVIKSTGNAVLDHAGLEAIRSAAPFPPFPAEFKKFSQLDIRMNFDYKAQKMPLKSGQGPPPTPAGSPSEPK